ncbi:MAG: SDR family oxidoreductase [Planctomycetaceae bacterium]|nr:SDR family oxidoreductase [Planctomycetaceae bacterium]
MSYLFLTGATGLLGSYLVRDWLQAGQQVAVLVRSTRFASAEDRMETLLAHWERQTGYPLPRPVVLEGDLTQEGLGLDASDTQWVRENCTSFVHNAASLTFYGEGPGTEPWRSNLDGTRHVIDFCRSTGIREFHHVSTAYVCGDRREGIVREDELDVGQKHGNDYEVSKFQAEQLVRNADCFDSLTVYRPGIIFGDSRTGYTTTFHGFYVPLKLVCTLIEKTRSIGVSREILAERIDEAGDRLLELLKLTGDEYKNFIPVDWVSSVMTWIHQRPDLHGRTYHLTPRQRTRVGDMQRVFQTSSLEFAVPQSRALEDNFDWTEFESFFFEQMGVYRSYWQDDPVFDCSNTIAAAPHLPCPEVDRDMLTLMCRYAIESGFGWPRPKTVKPEFSVGQFIRSHIPSSSAGTAADGVVGLQVNGPGGGQWELRLNHGRVIEARPGLTSQCTATFYLNTGTFRGLSDSRQSVDEAMAVGRLVIEGNGVPMPELKQALCNVATGRNDAAAGA